MSRHAERNASAKILVLGWFDGRDDLRQAAEVVAARHGDWVYADWVRNDDAPDLLPVVIDAGYAVLATGADRDEVLPPRQRVVLLKALAALEEANLDGGAL
jgi:hypothetical protein